MNLTHRQDRAPVVLVAIAMLAAVVLINAVPSPAGAVWRSNSGGLGTNRPIIYFDASVPTATRSPVSQGALRWNNLNGPARFVFETGTSPTRWNVSTPPPERVVGVMYSNIDGRNNVLADARSWVYTQDPSITYSSIVRYDTSETWSNITGGSIPAGSYDRFGLSTHELGHVLGLQHTTQGSQYCPTPDSSAAISVMCPTISPGNTRWRTPYPFDVGSYGQIYGSP